MIDRTFPHENAPTRKPGIALGKYLDKEVYDLENSFVIGDRLTDIELAKNLGAKGIMVNNVADLASDELTQKRTELDATIALETQDWKSIYEFLKLSDCTAE